MTWPDQKRFAFTVFDDADYDRLHNVKPVYDFLSELGIFTTKSIWPLAAEKEAPLGGLSTEDPEYLAWILSLQRAGFEIGFHGARCHSSPREATARALDALPRTIRRPSPQHVQPLSKRGKHLLGRNAAHRPRAPRLSRRQFPKHASAAKGIWPEALISGATFAGTRFSTCGTLSFAKSIR